MRHPPEYRTVRHDGLWFAQRCTLSLFWGWLKVWEYIGPFGMAGVGWRDRDQARYCCEVYRRNDKRLGAA